MFLAVISTREVKPILASCSVSEDSGLPRGAGKSREQTQQGETLSGRLLSFPPFFEVLLAKERQKQKISPPKSQARRLWTLAWKGNERIALIKMQRASRHSGVKDKDVALNGRSFIFRTLKWSQPCPGKFREARELLAHLDDLVTYFIAH